MTEEPICYEHCSPCEWYGICPHSFAEWDKERKEKDAKEQLCE